MLKRKWVKRKISKVSSFLVNDYTYRSSSLSDLDVSNIVEPRSEDANSNGHEQVPRD